MGFNFKCRDVNEGLGLAGCIYFSMQRFLVLDLYCNGFVLFPGFPQNGSLCFCIKLYEFL